MPKGKLKEQLSLTISPEMRAKARQLARKQRRSLSSLFEFYIAVDWEREKQKPKDPGEQNGGIWRVANVTGGIAAAGISALAP
jgi:hypothetical protein